MFQRMCARDDGQVVALPVTGFTPIPTRSATVMTTTRAARAAWLALALAAVGCGGTTSTGSVAGTVTYNGGPVTSGSLNLISSSGAAAAGEDRRRRRLQGGRRWPRASTRRT